MVSLAASRRPDRRPYPDDRQRDRLGHARREGPDHRGPTGGRLREDDHQLRPHQLPRGRHPPHTWISPQQSSNNPEDWYGISNPSTRAPYDSAKRYSYGLLLMEGRLSVAPPMQTLMACQGMPLPNSDND